MKHYLFAPYPEVSQQREVGELVSSSGATITLRWNGEDFIRDPSTDFVREIIE